MQTACRFVLLIGILSTFAGCQSTRGTGLRLAARVFGVPIYATAATPDRKIAHAARVLAGYLDSDEDGAPNNPAVVERLAEERAALLMFRDQAEADAFFSNELQLPSGAGWPQPLYGSETHPDGAARGLFDVALEEVLHLITEAGYARVYPGVFGDQSGSMIADAMDAARGGRFRNVPRSYPEAAWYSYDDQTCDYECQVAEYTYWALTSILGGQQFPGRLEAIEHEWRLNTREKVRARDPSAFDLLTDARYGLPTALPDGGYTGEAVEFVRPGMEQEEQTRATNGDVTVQPSAKAQVGHPIPERSSGRGTGRPSARSASDSSRVMPASIRNGGSGGSGRGMNAR